MIVATVYSRPDLKRSKTLRIWLNGASVFQLRLAASVGTEETNSPTDRPTNSRILTSTTIAEAAPTPPMPPDCRCCSHQDGVTWQTVEVVYRVASYSTSCLSDSFTQNFGKICKLMVAFPKHLLVSTRFIGFCSLMRNEHVRFDHHCPFVNNCIGQRMPCNNPSSNWTNVFLFLPQELLVLQRFPDIHRVRLALPCLGCMLLTLQVLVTWSRRCLGFSVAVGFGSGLRDLLEVLCSWFSILRWVLFSIHLPCWNESLKNTSWACARIWQELFLDMISCFDTLPAHAGLQVFLFAHCSHGYVRHQALWLRARRTWQSRMAAGLARQAQSFGSPQGKHLSSPDFHFDSCSRYIRSIMCMMHDCRFNALSAPIVAYKCNDGRVPVHWLVFVVSPLVFISFSFCFSFAQTLGRLQLQNASYWFSAHVTAPINRGASLPSPPLLCWAPCTLWIVWRMVPS